MNERPRSEPPPASAASSELALQQTWHQLGIDPQTIALRAGTAVATLALEDTVPVLPQLLSSLAPNARPQLELGAVLGEGGMGVVRLATQTALGREVAVKALHDDRASDGKGAQLLREGRVTGWIEHPNVVPVHDLGQDRAGRPLLVMKRIEGSDWAQLLSSASTAERVTTSYLQHHLHILRQIAGAVDFAHSRGILHRDIKPDNVMLGPFSEVYLVDWGIAVSLVAKRLPGVPDACDVKGIEGTPGYLSPEMATGDGRRLGIWSDVYLLGATLHHVITGAAPHRGDSVVGTIYKAHLSAPPTYDERVPGELAAIARRAMARDPKQRFACASDFGAALDAFLTHRGSLELCEVAELRVAELRNLRDEETRVEQAFHEARFGFEQALRSWPDNARARAGLQEALEHMAEFELSRGAARTADSLLRQCDEPSEVLARRVAEALAEAQAKEERLVRLERDVDLSFGKSHRIWLGLLTGVSWAAVCFACGAITRMEIYRVGHDALAGIGALATLISLAGAYASRAKVLVNTVNRMIAYATILNFAGGAVLVWLLGRMGVSLANTMVIVALLGGAVWTTVVFAVGPSRLPFAIGLFGVAIGAWLWPAYHFEIFGLMAIPLVVTMYFMSRSRGRDV